MISSLAGAQHSEHLSRARHKPEVPEQGSAGQTAEATNGRAADERQHADSAQEPAAADRRSGQNAAYACSAADRRAVQLASAAGVVYSAADWRQKPDSAADAASSAATQPAKSAATVERARIAQRATTAGGDEQQLF